MKELRKYKCNGCFEIIGPTYDYERQCLNCSSTLLEKVELTAEDYIQLAANSLEDSNYHDFVDLPEKLFNSIKKKYPVSEEVELARIIAEEFYKNI